MRSKNQDIAGLILFIFLFLVIVSVVVLFSVNNFSFGSSSAILQRNVLEGASKVKKLYYIESNNLEPKSIEYINLHGFISTLKRYPQMEINVIEGVGSDYRRLEEIVNNAYAEGARYVFLSGFEMNNALGNIFRRFSDVKFFVSCIEVSDSNVVSYTDKTYVSKYMAGFISGIFLGKNKNSEEELRYMMYDSKGSGHDISKDFQQGNIGYIANSCSTYEKRNINAFALGLEHAFAEKKLYVLWLNQDNTEEQNFSDITRFLKKYNIKVLDGTNSPCKWCRYAVDNNLYYFDLMVKGAENKNGTILGKYFYDPSIIFSTLVESIAADSRGNSNNYFFGYSDNVIGFDYTKSLARELSEYDSSLYALISKKVSDLSSGREYVFKGKIYNNKGLLMLPEGFVFTDEELLHEMNWLNENVVETNTCLSPRLNKHFVIRSIMFNNP
ncbi:Basic membrane lipoprotein Med, substrate-binding protein (PBP1-ABC) superfamily [Ruminobacter amylophilus]|uniref:Basic membrane lipoprotein Med, substrate-binding protein (PBP1-ABC) superfamily n=1 Tax=Ruminobacter amylophilus TaxID=867 RepID=A0A662ZIW1_9GAMM|nr:hypothetical protein [Ruminobacter amylophilus]SFP17336.1 Basic membrane lipoprotein Med, substrate-binding protein (PBP1-ABC) superfamily [Ruminobacter amylophilus]